MKPRPLPTRSAICEHLSATLDNQIFGNAVPCVAVFYGAHAERAETVDQLAPLIRAGLDRSGPTVIEVLMSDRVDELISIIPWLESQ